MTGIRISNMKIISQFHDNPIAKIDLFGGALCLDFINTIQNRTKEPPKEYLNTREDWVAWLVRAGLISLPAALNMENIQIPFLVRHRERLFRLMTHLIRSEAVPDSLWHHINAGIQKAFTHIVLTNAYGTIQSQWSFDKADPMNYQNVIFKSLYDLLLSQSPARIKICDGCGWLFSDTSKNNSRKWCDMRFCGSQDKSKRYYRRKTKQQQG